jgi:hypothetical protein
MMLLELALGHLDGLDIDKVANDQQGHLARLIGDQGLGDPQEGTTVDAFMRYAATRKVRLRIATGPPEDLNAETFRLGDDDCTAYFAIHAVREADGVLHFTHDEDDIVLLRHGRPLRWPSLTVPGVP